MVHILRELDVVHFTSLTSSCFSNSQFSPYFWWSVAPSTEVIVLRECHGSESMFLETTRTQIPHEHIPKLWF